MTRTVLSGAVVVLLGAVVAVVGGALGIPSLWPVLLAVAIGLAAGRVSFGRTAGYVLGLFTAFAAMAVTAGLLPAVPSARAVVLALAVVVLTAVAVVSADRVPLWAGLAGYAAFSAFYEPMYAARPTAFLAEAPVALATVLVATGVGVAAASLLDLVPARVPNPGAAVPVADAEVAR
ncbi:hypothetical protein [Egicoccus halophilus]|uniref:Uncharacterized protein n=1 Tax=Egicoccus halophilus TaxID=1670830 RepID=A0A8J3A709_9ACTN|nr:hypothetical protein [Egicoccus halophilus]GGI03227.1 hypothetical protein GCM10011354_03050 [Egicoccus halophilus]